MFTRVMSYELSSNDERGDIPQSFRGRAHHDASLRSGSAPSKSRRERLLDRLVSTLGEIGLVLTELWKLQQLAVVHVQASLNSFILCHQVVSSLQASLNSSTIIKS